MPDSRPRPVILITFPRSMPRAILRRNPRALRRQRKRHRAAEESPPVSVGIRYRIALVRPAPQALRVARTWWPHGAVALLTPRPTVRHLDGRFFAEPVAADRLYRQCSGHLGRDAFRLSDFWRRRRL